MYTCERFHSNAVIQLQKGHAEAHRLQYELFFPQEKHFAMLKTSTLGLTLPQSAHS